MERPSADARMMTTFIFRVRNVPAALYKAMGGFATNGVNMTKLESYQLGAFTATLFYADIEGHPDDPHVKLALDELKFFSREMRILGVYPRSELARVEGRERDELDHSLNHSHRQDEPQRIRSSHKPLTS